MQRILGEDKGLMEEISKVKVKISVRNLVEFVLRCGDLDNRFTGGNSRAVEGTKIHSKLQAQNKKIAKEKENYTYDSEVFLKYEVSYEDVDFVIEGRADELFIEENKVTINEIKSTGRELKLIDENFNMVHWAQVICYGYIYANENNIKELTVSLTYFNIEDEDTKVLQKEASVDYLEKEFFSYLKKYVYWAKDSIGWKGIRKEAIKKCEFPFENYRKGQRELAVSVYRTIRQKKKLFVKAPTGIGKTISTLFPAIKVLEEEEIEKIFYLTAKGTTAISAASAVKLMAEKGLRFRTLILTSKEKICFNDEVNCNPDECVYAKGHYDRVNAALKDILQNEDTYTKEKVELYARKHNVCPFELSLDITSLCDLIICDYNYVFDPSVYLKSFFSDAKGNYVFLIDEAHNLPDRAREMYSSELYKSKVMYIKKNLSKKDYIYKSINSINTFFVKMKKLSEDKGFFVDEELEYEEAAKAVYKFLNKCEKWIAENKDHEIYKEIQEFYLEAFKFIKTYELYGDNYIFYGEKVSKDFKIKLFCLDPSKFIKGIAEKGISSVFFSATLSPMNYFREILGAEEGDYNVTFNSPFSEDNRVIFIARNISTKYQYREKNYDSVVQYIKSFVKGKRGNYMVFFPSYKYMRDIYDRFSDIKGYNTIIQESNMNEIEKNGFLASFDKVEDEGVIGFCVLGGIFSEGIDLKGEKLIGAVVVGVGLPMICLERDMIKKYFNSKNNLGYEYSYMYPGMNKVLQAAGRVIRSENDKGAIMLLDERFATYNYRKLMPCEWEKAIISKENLEIEKKLEKFWADC
ncbi:3'-5' exonuclease DinG [Clostridium felsineum]|uniref:3'-5' exonuclease DinG n=2 Tax=Clostridium felsineum TaxID=36839 RepID=A0A1S8L0B5_9CLOT|nr:ATP-dependent DNA helicase [Clostridium felsineum]URZ11425.1 3'-5' exonuclease DinG [Clostridium felsineum]